MSQRARYWLEDLCGDYKPLILAIIVALCGGVITYCWEEYQRQQWRKQVEVLEEKVNELESRLRPVRAVPHKLEEQEHNGSSTVIPLKS